MDRIQFLMTLSASVGLVSLLRSLMVFLQWVWGSFLRPSKDLKAYGSWAMVTGPTDGIGKAMALRLAQKGLNLVLVGRNPAKLSSVTGEIQGKFPDVEIKRIICDFAEDLEVGINRIKEGIKGLDVGVLINNVGAGSPRPRFFHEADDEYMENLIRVNVMAATKVSHVVLPGMLERRKGAIVNLGSGSASFMPSFPLATVYYATKSYVESFSRSLHEEYKQHGICVQCQAPLYVSTKMTRKRPDFFVPSADECADGCLRWVGQEVLCTPYWPHSIQQFLFSLLPDKLLNWLLLRRFVALRHKMILKEQFSKDS